MVVYFILLALILVGQLFVRYKVIKKLGYCVLIGLCMMLLSGLRAETVGMWDTQSVYLPSFRVINQYSIAQLLTMEDTQYRFIGFDLYSKFIGMISQNSNFFIFMMACPFFVAITYLIYKHSDIPMYSFLALLGLGYLTYSFSMIRGMLAYAALAMAFDAAIEEKWKKFIIWTIIGSLFHITSLLFLLVYFLKKTKWTARRIIIIFVILVAGQRAFPEVWKWFVSRFISGWLNTYNFYAIKGGMLADALLFVYIFTVLVAVLKINLTKAGRKAGRIHSPRLRIKKNRKKEACNYLTEDALFNLYLGMAIFATVLIFLTSVLSEMIRIAMILGLGVILLVGRRIRGISKRNKMLITIAETLQAVLYIVYFFVAALPNMNAVPYKFFWQ